MHIQPGTSGRFQTKSIAQSSALTTEILKLTKNVIFAVTKIPPNEMILHFCGLVKMHQDGFNAVFCEKAAGVSDWFGVKNLFIK